MKSIASCQGHGWFGLLLMGSLVSSAYASSTATDNLSVTATVVANCSLSTSSLSFGDYDPLSGSVAGTGGVSVTCTRGTAATITLGQGANADTGSTDDAPVRRMKKSDSADYLPYQLYSDNTRTTVWANTNDTGIAHTGDGTSASLTVYGQIAAGQNVPPGSYSDTVVVTVTY
ncbi:Csu type fimbrial protein [Oceanimonas marisflavi]|uniref:Csu type fimbrial protein n=1 Tax=Oceanimonas marisflavi TaxID=2059724 RepID=UPI000D30041C|nr:spore coat U domain-containing protein [Oceanimonas marisflavi]